MLVVRWLFFRNRSWRGIIRTYIWTRRRCSSARLQIVTNHLHLNLIIKYICAHMQIRISNRNSLRKQLPIPIQILIIKIAITHKSPPKFQKKRSLNLRTPAHFPTAWRHLLTRVIWRLICVFILKRGRIIADFLIVTCLLPPKAI